MPTLLEQVLQLHGEFRKSLAPITPLQAGVLLFLRRHADATMTEAVALRLSRRGLVLAQRIEQRVRHVDEQARRALKGHRA
jgi:hypothetical protein